MALGESITPTNRDALIRIRAAALSRQPISLGSRRTNSPHEFYRYPGRFTPTFAEAAIEAFSRSGDLVIDPFVGGGTTALEALKMGRRCLAADLNPLATFITRVKTRPLRSRSQIAVQDWINRLPRATLINQRLSEDDTWISGGYLNGIKTSHLWRLTKVIGLALQELNDFDETPSNFCRCIVLRTAQWALDMRRQIPDVAEFRRTLISNADAMLNVAKHFAETMPARSKLPYIVNRGVPGLADLITSWQISEPTLILTSPPYPGVYINYHRWKLQGRLEIRAPYWIADQLDGHGLAHYTMHSRADRTLNTYFRQLQMAFDDIKRLANPATVVVQLVGFNDPIDQLPRYLNAMDNAGFREVRLNELQTADDGRLWRSVPSRRWWAEAQSRRSIVPHTAHEVVLIHRIK